MAFKLSAKDKKRRDALTASLRQHKQELEGAVAAFNEAVEALKEPVNTVLAKYNEALEEARGFCEDIANDAYSQISEKSDKWQESDPGQLADQWAQQWQEIDLDDASVDLPEDDAVLDFDDHADLLEGLPEGADS